MKEGRIADGSVYICAHGKNHIQQSIVDWHPFEQYTIKSPVPGGGFGFMTTCFTQHGDGTTATLYFGKTQGGPSLLRGLVNLGTPRMVGPTVQKGLDALMELIESEINAGKIAQQPAAHLSDEQIEDALVESLTQS